MNRTVRVALGNSAQAVGWIRYNQDGRRESSAFEYDPAWLAASDRFAIDPSLPLVAGLQFPARGTDSSIFHGAIADSEPNGWAAMVILRDHAKRRSAERVTGRDRPPILGALDFLLEVDDFSREGALRYADEEGVFRRAPSSGRRTPPMLELAQLLASTRAVETHTETEADLAYLRGKGTSLQGLRPKCTIVDDDGALAIGKFPSVHDERSVTKGEVLALSLARAAGIDAAESRIVMSQGSAVAIIRRFDRQDGERLMYVSAATLMQARDDQVIHTYGELVDTLRMHSAAFRTDVEELWRRIAFSILITNVDDHLHNHGFLHTDRENWRLSPAFDLNPFPDRHRELKTWISEEAGPSATIDALMSSAAYFGLTILRAREVLRQVEEAVSTWRQCGRQLGMTAAELDQFADAFEHPERTAAQAECSKG